MMKDTWGTVESLRRLMDIFFTGVCCLLVLTKLGGGLRSATGLDLGASPRPLRAGIYMYIRGLLAKSIGRDTIVKSLLILLVLLILKRVELTKQTLAPYVIPQPTDALQPFHLPSIKSTGIDMIEFPSPLFHLQSKQSYCYVLVHPLIFAPRWLS